MSSRIVGWILEPSLERPCDFCGRPATCVVLAADGVTTSESCHRCLGPLAPDSVADVLARALTAR